MRVLVVGAHGQLGAAVVARMGDTHEVAALARTELDVTRSNYAILTATVQQLEQHLETKSSEPDDESQRAA